MIGPMNNLAASWWAWIAPITIQVAALAALVWLVDLVLKKRGWPQVRYALWILVFVKLLLPPSFALPTSISAPLMAAFALPESAAAAPEVAPVVAPNPVRATTAPAVPFVRQPDLTASESPAMPTPLPGPVVASVGSAAPAKPFFLSRLSWKAWAMLVWAAGVMGMFAYLATRVFGFMRALERSARELPEPLRAALERAAARLGVKRLPRVVMTDAVCGAAAFGVLRPVILLPAACRDTLSPGAAEHVLLHELAHVRRGDLVANAFQTVFALVYWFNPLVWLAARRCRHMRELCCDATVASLLRDDTSDYRATLVEEARRILMPGSTFGLGLLGLFESPARLRARLEHLASPIWRTHRRRVVAAVIALVLMALCVVPMAQSRSRASAEEAGKFTISTLPTEETADYKEYRWSVEGSTPLRLVAAWSQRTQQEWKSFGAAPIAGIKGRGPFLLGMRIPKGRGCPVLLLGRSRDDYRPLFELPEHDFGGVEFPGESVDVRSSLPFRMNLLAIDMFQKEGLRDSQLLYHLHLAAENSTESPFDAEEYGRVTGASSMAAQRTEAVAVAPEANRFRRTLASGVTVELIGISTHPSNPASWWRPDGTPLADSPCDSVRIDMSGPDAILEREYACKIEHALPEEPGVTLEFTPRGNESANLGPGTKMGRELPGVTLHAQAFPEGTQSASLRVGIAAGEWQTRAGNYGSRSGGWFHEGFLISPPAQTGSDVMITASGSASEPSERRIIAIKRDGAVIKGSIVAGAGEAGNIYQVTSKFTGLSLDEVEEFRFQTRPYEWAEFTDVRLNPRKDAVRASLAAAPPFADVAAPTPGSGVSGAPQTAAITGTVLNENGEPMAGVRIDAFHISSNRSPVVIVETGADGKFSFNLPLPFHVSGLLTSEWILVAKGPDAIAFHKVILNNDGIAKRRLHPTEWGGFFMDMETDPAPQPVEIRLVPAKGRIAGIVSDSSGKGFSDVEVRILQLSFLPPDTGEYRDLNLTAAKLDSLRTEWLQLCNIPELKDLFVTRTHFDGGFIFTGLPPGYTAYLDVNVPGMFPADPVNALRLRVGEQTGSIVMQQTGTIKGRFERPPAHIEFGTRIDLEGLTAPGFKATADVLDALDPSFTFEGVPPGEYAVYATSWREFVQAPPDKVLVEPGKTAEITVKLVVGSHVRGRVVDSETGAGIHAANLSAACKAFRRRVGATNGDGFFDIILAPGDYSLTVTPANYGLHPRLRELAGLPPPAHLKPDAPILFTVKEGANLRVPDIKLVPKDSAGKPPTAETPESAPAPAPSAGPAVEAVPAPPLAASAESAPEPADSDEPESPAGPPGVTITGTVLDENGEPAAGVEVGALKHLGDVESSVRTTSEQDGRFALTPQGGPRDSWTLFARAPERIGFLETRMNADGSMPDETIRLVPRDAAIEGTVKDKDGRPLPNITVQVLQIRQYPPESDKDGTITRRPSKEELKRRLDLEHLPPLKNWYRGRTYQAGQFRIPNLPRGCWVSIRYGGEGYGTVEYYNGGSTDDKAAREITMAPEAKIEGRVFTRDEGLGVGGIGVAIGDAGGPNRISGRTTTSDDGTFSFAGLAEGTVTLAAPSFFPTARDAYVFVPGKPVTLKAGKTVKVELEITGGSLVTGRVIYEAGGKGIERIAVTAGAIDGPPVSYANTDAQGWYTLRVPGGKFRLSFAWHSQDREMVKQWDLSEQPVIEATPGRDLEVPPVLVRARPNALHLPDAEGPPAASDKSPASDAEPADVTDVPSAEFFAGGDKDKRYLLFGGDNAEAASAGGYGLVVVLPGGDGSDGFRWFVKRIWKLALSADYLVAEPVAAKWNFEQKITWPTRKSGVFGQKFTTEELVEAVINDVKAKHRIDAGRVFVLGWSSGGPAAYATALGAGTQVRGAFVAMSVFQPQNLPALSAARGRGFYIYHSGEDALCPFWMAQAARDALAGENAAVELATYSGGHGWCSNDVYGDIRKGIKWLESKSGKDRSAVTAR